MPKGSSTVILGPCKGANPRLDTRGLPEAQDLRFAASSRALAGGLLRSANSGSRSTRRVQGHLGLRRWLQHVATDSLSLSWTFEASLASNSFSEACWPCGFRLPGQPLGPFERDKLLDSFNQFRQNGGWLIAWLSMGA